MQPLVSIIIPTYNRAHLIGETLESVIAQTYQNWECIVVDDGSTDATEELMGFYCEKDTRIQYHNRPKYKQKGANACRNYGFEMSKGDYIQWLDSDDLLTPDHLEKKVQIFQRLKGLECVLCESISFTRIKGKFHFIQKFPIQYINFHKDFVQRSFFLNTASAMWDIGFFRKHQLDNLFDETLSQSQDYDFYFRVFLYDPKFFIIKEPLLRYRKSIESISSKFIESEPSHINSYLIVKSKILHQYEGDSNVYKKILNNITTALRGALSIKDYKQGKLYLEFLKKYTFLKSWSLTFSYLKIKTLFVICCYMGKGAFYFRKYFNF